MKGIAKEQGRRRVLKKWSGGGNHRVPTAREGESTRGELGTFFLIFSASMCVFNGFLCVWDQISVTNFC